MTSKQHNSSEHEAIKYLDTDFIVGEFIFHSYNQWFLYKQQYKKVEIASTFFSDNKNDSLR